MALRDGLQDSFDEFDSDEKNPTHLFVYGERFTLASVQRLTTFLRNGRNRFGLPVHQLELFECTFDDDDSHLLLRDGLARNNEFPNLMRVEFGNIANQQHAESLVLGLCDNQIVQELSLNRTIGGKVVGNLLQRNHRLELLDLGPVNHEFVQAAREGLLASRGRLTSLAMRTTFDDEHHDDDVDMTLIDNKVLRELVRIYTNNDQNIITVLVELYLSANDIRGPIGGTLLRRLLATMPCLYKLDVSENYFGPEGAVELFRRGSHIHQIPSLTMESCYIGNVGLAQMLESTSCNSPLVYLQLVSNDIEGRVGGETLASLLPRCPQLESLHLRSNRLGLAPGFVNHPGLQYVDMDACGIADDGATSMITSLATIQCLKHVNLRWNYLPPAALVPLTALLNQTRGVLEKIDVSENRLLFRTANDDELGPFFDAIAKHNHIKELKTSDCGMNQQTEGLLSSAVLKNRTLLKVNGRCAGRMRRDKLLTLIESTMASPDDIRFGVWPVVLGVWAPRVDEVGSHPIFCLVQKMAEVNAFSLLLAREKASRMIQRSWRRHRPTLAALRFRKSQVASLKAEIAALRADLSKKDDLDDNHDSGNGDGGINHVGSLSPPSYTAAAHGKRKRGCFGKKVTNFY